MINGNLSIFPIFPGNGYIRKDYCPVSNFGDFSTSNDISDVYKRVLM